LDSEWTTSATTASVSATPQSIDAFVIDDVASDENTRPAEIEVSAVDDAVPEIAGYTHEMAMLDTDILDDRRTGEDTIGLDVGIPVADLVDATPFLVALEAATETAPTDPDEAVDTDSAELGNSTIAAADVEVPMTPVVAEPSTPTPTSIAVEMSAPADTTAPETERRARWELQRAHAEQLLEAGDRAAGVQALEQVAVDLERIGDLERALTIVDELIRLTPDSIRHHQKRVELAFRSNDRAKLTDAYIELGDALFRSGEEKKARAVYQRVLELAPDDARARAAVESVSWMSPPMGSGAIPAIGHTPPSIEPRVPSPPARPHPRDARVPYQSGPATGNRGAGGIASPTPARKPSPLDRSAASNGEFVDLGDWIRSGESPKSTRMVAEEKPPTGDEQADFQEMLKRFKQGVAENVDDEDYESHYDLGIAYKEMGLMDEAVAEFQKALRGSTHRVRTYEALGQCFVEKEQYQVAASVLSRAIALGEGDDHHLVGVLYLLGRAMEALSKHGDALDYYQRVFAVDIDFRDVADRISAIEGKAT
jgi:tetratricopeptide (TPR) repeat protein